MKNIRFCAFTLLRFCEAYCWILERFQKPPFLWISTFDIPWVPEPQNLNERKLVRGKERREKGTFLIFFFLLFFGSGTQGTFDSVFENLRFCGVFVRISVNTVTKTEVFLSVFVQKRSSVNGA